MFVSVWNKAKPNRRQINPYKKTQGISQIHLLHGLSTPACPFFGVWPVATGVVMVEYITPPDLPLMDSQLGSS